MNFEDIVDMDWVDTHTTLEDPNEFSSELFFDHQPDFLLDQPPRTPPQQPATVEPEIKMEPISNMPTTEQIKQLIEIAKRQLALREQQYQQQQQQAQQAQEQQQQQQVEQQPTLFHPIIDTTAPSITVTEPQINVAAPSNIFSMPPIPALSPTTIATSDITAVENGTTLESISESLSKQLSAAAAAQAAATASEATPTTTDTTSNDISSTTTTSSNNLSPEKRRDSLASMPDESISLEAYAEADGIDLKKLTPKERRQLRNKLSARNFRVRRKEYISTLEGQVNDHKMAAEALKEKLAKVEEENEKLRKEMDILKRQNQMLLAQQQQQQKSPRIMSSPLPKPNFNKDISIMGTKATDSYRQQDNFILVSNAIMPVWDYNAILNNNNNKNTQKSSTTFKNNEYMNHLAGEFLLSVVQLASSMPSHGTNQIKDDDFRLPLMPDDRDFSSSTTIKSSISSSSSSITTSTHNNSTASTSPSSLSTTALSPYSTTKKSSLSYMEDLYDALIQSALINSSNSDKSFWWWDNNSNNSQSQAM